MKKAVYQQLARQLDKLPNGFPETKSGVELKLLAKIFEPQEAAAAAVMRLNCETAGVIAERIQQEVQPTYETLKNMTRKGLIRIQRKEGELRFGLMPFVVGFYEEQLPRLDEEMAALFEQYFLETRGFQQEKPPVHRVIPVEESIPWELEIFPSQRASELIEGAKSWGVRKCICRVQQQLIGQACEHPIENCLVFAPVEGAFDHSDVTRAVSLEEALRILHEAKASGLVHTTGNYAGPHHYICNCCTCSCGILRGVTEFDLPTAIARSRFSAKVDQERCLACEDCLTACQFGALSFPADGCLVDETKCVGCGLCAAVCPAEAMCLEARPASEFEPIPETIKDWNQRRAEERGISLEDIF